MKNNTIIAMLTLTSLWGMQSCDSMDTDNWIENSLILLNWEAANPETGKRPIYVDELQVRYYTVKDSRQQTIINNIQGSEQGYEIPSGDYNIMAVQPSKYITRDEEYKTVTFELPTEMNEAEEVTITEIPGNQYFVGNVSGEKIHLDTPLQTEIHMKAILKKLNFVVVVEDTAEMTNQVIVDISGMAYKKKLWNMAMDEKDDGVQVFNLTKYGRYLNNKTYITSFRGSTYCLGACGRNILYLTLFNSEGKKIFLKYDITSYLKNWNTNEETVHIRLNFLDEDNLFYIEGWDEGNTVDIVFDYSDKEV